MRLQLCGEALCTNLAMKLGHTVALSLVQTHGGPHALIAAVITAGPTWNTKVNGYR